MFQFRQKKNKSKLNLEDLNKRVATPLWLSASKRVLFFLIVAICGAGLGYQFSNAVPSVAQIDHDKLAAKSDVMKDFNALSQKISDFENKQAKSGVRIVGDVEVQQAISDVTLNDSLGHVALARKALRKLEDSLDSWNKQLAETIRTRAVTVTADPSQNYDIPILMYHYTPGDFEYQLRHLLSRGYTAITLDQLNNAFRHRDPLPAKPVVITFDDGYENQLQAFALLEKYQMPATFYIVTSGGNSNWCVGAGRTNASCGDAYLNWDQVRQLASSSLVTIGAHTVNHANLANLSPEQQRSEIFDSKTQLEQQLKRTVRHFAYPYGSFNATTIGLIGDAGFITAVSTIPGTIQGMGNIFTLHRVRSALSLP